MFRHLSQGFILNTSFPRKGSLRRFFPPIFTKKIATKNLRKFEGLGLSVIFDGDSEYYLIFNHKDDAEFSVQLKFKEFYITARNMDKYAPESQELEINPEHQYIEVGAGLGGFIEYLLKYLKPGSPKPIVIDPADYEVIRNMLAYSETLDLNEKMRAEACVMLRRANLMLDKTKVNVINMTLEDALDTYSNLENSADVVVDNFGANKYGLGRELDAKLLKPNGKLISYF